MQKWNPDALFVFEEAFHSDASLWNDLFDDDDTTNVVLDTHKYHAWSPQSTIEEQCQVYRDSFAGLQGLKYDLWVGEWSFATDVCAMWLNGW